MNKKPTTRMELFKEYRQEIINQSQFMSNFDSQSEIVKKYKKKIDSLSPNILSNVSMQKENIIVPLLSVDKIQHDKFEELKKFKLLVNQEKINQVSNKLNDFIYQYENNSIIDHNSKSLSEKWLTVDPKYLQLKNIELKLKMSQEKLIKFVEKSGKKIERLNSVIEKSNASDAVGNLSEFEVKKIERPKNIKSKKRKIFYFTIISLLGILVVVSIILIIIVIQKRFS